MSVCNRIHFICAMPFSFCGPAFSTPLAFVYVYDFFGSLFHFVRDKRECNEGNENRCESSSICIRNLCLHKLLLLLRDGEMDPTDQLCFCTVCRVGRWQTSKIKNRPLYRRYDALTKRTQYNLHAMRCD